MKVVFVGFPKCGTKTMATAFEILGLNNYDYPEQFTEQARDWLKIYESGGTKEDFRRMFEGVDSCTDAPACCFWEEILEAHPDCKFVLTQRKSTEDWWRSMKKQQKENEKAMTSLMHLSPYGRLHMTFFRQSSFALFGHMVCPESQCNETLNKRAYRQHNANVMQNCPKDKLLIYEFKQGWEPLCKFLNLPVPDQEFPFRNKGGDITRELMENHEMFQRMKREILRNGSVLILLIAVVGCMLFF